MSLSDKGSRRSKHRPHISLHFFAMAVDGSVGLAPLFDNVADFFDRVYIDNSCGSNFQHTLLKLDCAWLRLSRWGEAIKLSGGVVLPSVSRVPAEAYLREILNLFTKAFKTRKKPGDQRPVGHNDRTDLDPMTNFLHHKLRQLSRKRRIQAPRNDQIRFTLDEKQLNDLNAKITNYTNGLVNLFPAAKKDQEVLAANEVSELSESFRALSEAAAEQDEALLSALKQVLKPANNLMTFNTEKSTVQKIGTDTSGTYTMTVSSPPG